MSIATRTLGRTAVSVTVLGLGGGPLGGAAETTDAESHAIVDAGYRGGIRYFDCAPLYGTGRSEHVVGDGLRNRDGWTLSTKVGHLLSRKPGAQRHGAGGFSFKPHFDYSYDGAMRSYEDSLQRLGLDHIDVLYIHDLDIFTHGERYPEVFELAMKGAYRALDELRRSGDIRAIGLGVNDARPVDEALDRGQWDAFLLAGRYTLLEQRPLDGLLAKVERGGASIVVGGPFNSGVLVGRKEWNYRPAPAEIASRVDRLAAICSSHGVPLPAAALQFPVAHPAVAAVIPGARSVAELEEILAWWQIAIPAGLWRDLKSAGLLHPDAPTPG